MNSIYTSTTYQSILFVVLIVVLFILEQFFSLRKNRNSLIPRLIVNVSLSLLSFAIVFYAVFPAQEITLGWTSNTNFGLLHLLELPLIIEGIIAFLLMDLAFYYWHLLNHTIPLLWRFHNVHHIDPDLDVSTAFRFHFGEIGLSTLFRIIQISIIGVSPFVFLIYELCFTANTILQHSNIKLPIKFERVLNKIFVTPRMHGIHHSQTMNETNSNYSTVFSWWDKIHKTIRLNIPQDKIVIGIPAYPKSEDNNLLNVLFLPFKKQREYWKNSDGIVLIGDEKISFKDRLKLEE